MRNRPKIVVFTPTYRPGIETTFSCLMAQDTQPCSMTWFLADELRDEREEHVRRMYNDAWFDIVHAKVPTRDGCGSNLASTHKAAFKFARGCDADILILLQDYIWVPVDGVQKFVDFHKDHSYAISTGLCHHAEEPTLDHVEDPNDPFCIFRNTTDGKEPRGISWKDVREKGEKEPYITTPMHWEANWAAVGRGVLHDEELDYDEMYDAGIAHENQDYAMRVLEKGYGVWQLEDNIAKSYPHRLYWDDDGARRDELGDINRKIHDEKWGGRIPMGEIVEHKPDVAIEHGARLEVGAGDTPTPGYIHNDIRALPDIELVCDALKIAEHTDAKFSELKANHILEHFSWKDTVAVLINWRNLLQDGGRINIHVPNFSWQTKAHVSGELDDVDVVNYVYGDQDHDGNYHMAAFTESLLETSLLKAGFTDIVIEDIGMVLTATAVKRDG